MREQWCSDAANQPQRCRIQRRAGECAQCTQWRPAVQCDLVSGFVRFQWQLAIAAPTRMPTKTAITVVGPQPGASGTEARQQDEGLIKTKAARRVVSLRGMRAKRRRVCLGRHKEPVKPARKFAHSSEAISIRWRPIFPSGPLPETSGDVPSDWSRKKSLRSLALRAGVLWVVVGGAQQRLDTFFERRLRCCARCCKNSATRAQLGPPNWISA